MVKQRSFLQLAQRDYFFFLNNATLVSDLQQSKTAVLLVSLV